MISGSVFVPFNVEITSFALNEILSAEQKKNYEHFHYQQKKQHLVFGNA